MDLNIVILAAGKGTRMYSNLPKVLHKIADKTMLEYVINTANLLNPSKLIVVVGHQAQLVATSLETLDTDIRAKLTVVEQKEQLGTAHAVSVAMPYVNKGALTCVLYGDAPLTPKDALVALVESGKNADMSLLTTILDDPFGYGRIVRDANGNILCNVEQKDADEKTALIKEINTGMICLNEKTLTDSLPKIGNQNANGEYYLTDLVGLLVSEGKKVAPVCYQKGESWLGVNTKAQLAIAERLYQEGRAYELMAKGLTLADPKRFDLRGELTFGQDCFIDINVIINGKVKLGDNVSIGAGCVISDCTIDDNSVISPYTIMEKSELKKHNTIGPFARLRPGNVLEDEVHIGNFVEVKNSHIGYGTKSGHLSYLGDSQIGRDVNIGAGTITCNYDGANKHKTVIGDDVFVGSDTQLVAPVTVGKGVTIGAGSTVTRDIEENLLYVSRAHGRSITGYERPHKKK